MRMEKLAYHGTHNLCPSLDIHLGDQIKKGKIGGM
jgi:hypothetical protein